MNETTNKLCGLWQQSSELVRLLIDTLQQGVAAGHASEEHWERLFGSKDSAVSNLQKLVAVLTVISERLTSEMCVPPEAQEETAAMAIQEEDVAMVMRWAQATLATLTPPNEAPSA